MGSDVRSTLLSSFFVSYVAEAKEKGRGVHIIPAVDPTKFQT